MNNKGQVMVFAVMLGLVIIIVALALAPAVSQSTTSAMNTSVGDTIGMDCNNDTISDFNKAACVAVDISLPYFVGVLLLIGGAVVTARIIFG